MDDRKQVVEDAFNNQEPSRVPVGFWYHFTPFSDHCNGLKNTEIIREVVEGHKKMYSALKVDFLKIMGDGFFGHPGLYGSHIETAEDLKQIQPIGKDHPWIREQVKMVNEILESVNGEVQTFYSVFSPLQNIRIYFFEEEDKPDKFVKLFFENPDAMVAAAEIIENDTKLLIDALMTETKLDGIYYSVQAVQDKRADKEFHDKYVRPTDTAIMNHINKYRENILLHICGWGEFTNDLTFYTEYPARIINWATNTEKISLSEGKKMFHDKPVLGGFDNNPGTLLYTGSDEEIREYIYKLLDESGTRGVLIGADCTIDPSIDLERLKFVKQVAAEYVQNRK